MIDLLKGGWKLGARFQRLDAGDCHELKMDMPEFAILDTIENRCSNIAEYRKFMSRHFMRHGRPHTNRNSKA